jgi:hypothetical protein
MITLDDKGMSIATPAQVLTGIWLKQPTAIQEAALGAVNARMGATIFSQGSAQKELATIKTIQTIVAQKKAGVPLDPAQIAVTQNVELQRAAKLSESKTKLVTTVINPLVSGTATGIIAKEQLLETTDKFTALMDKYNELLEEGTGNIDIKQLLIYGALAIGGIVVLSMFIKK